MDYLVDDLLAYAVRCLDDCGQPTKSISIECLRDVLTDNPEISTKIQQLMAAKLREL